MPKKHNKVVNTVAIAHPDRLHFDPATVTLALYEMLKLVPKSKLASPLKEIMDKEVLSIEHKNDKGPIHNWFTDSSLEHLLVIVINTQQPIGIIYFGGTNDSIDVGWWIVCQYRGMGYGNKAIDELALFLKNRGVNGIGNITIDTYLGKSDAASSKLVKRVKQYFI